VKTPLKTALFSLAAFAVIIALGLLYLLKADTSLAVKGPAPVVDYRELPVLQAPKTEIASELDAPWGFAWLPDGSLLVTERFGKLLLIPGPGQPAVSIAGVPEVFSIGQAGLFDVSVHPQFEQSPYIYLSYAHGDESSNRLRVLRAKLNVEGSSAAELADTQIIFEVAHSKAGSGHFGSRFQWLPDGTLLVSVGDGGNPPTQYQGKLIREQAQELGTHFGSVIRINDDGTVPENNPFVDQPGAQPEIWSYGHRNIQGLTFDSDLGRAIASEHGSKGGDELNALKAGKNYGWPLTTYATEYNLTGSPITDRQSLPDMEDPLAVWTPSIAPSGIVHYTGERYGDWRGNLFLAAMLLRADNSIFAYLSSPAGAVLRIQTDNEGEVRAQQRIDMGQWRVRDIGQGPDGFLYVLTDDTERQDLPGARAGRLWRIDSR
jgi:glucose/arabinose dehydrogenase